MGPPYDIGFYFNDTRTLSQFRIDSESPLLDKLRRAWERHLLNGIAELPAIDPGRPDRHRRADHVGRVAANPSSAGPGSRSPRGSLDRALPTDEPGSGRRAGSGRIGGGGLVYGPLRTFVPRLIRSGPGPRNENVLQFRPARP